MAFFNCYCIDLLPPQSSQFCHAFWDVYHLDLGSVLQHHVTKVGPIYVTCLVQKLWHVALWLSGVLWPATARPQSQVQGVLETHSHNQELIVFYWGKLICPRSNICFAFTIFYISKCIQMRHSVCGWVFQNGVRQTRVIQGPDEFGGRAAAWPAQQLPSLGCETPVGWR